MSAFIVGIDLGTTNTVVAYCSTSDAVPTVKVFEVPQFVARGEVLAKPVLPSARYHASAGELEGGQDVVVGAFALALGSKTPGRLVTSAKSWLSHSGVDRNAAILPWGAAADVLKVSPVEASASYLAHLRTAWDQAHPRAPLAGQEIVLTVPASFDDVARGLTVQAAKLAGLDKVRLLEEPQAAFYDWLDRHRTDPSATLGGARLVLVCDVGGGTTDLTLVRVEHRESGIRLTRVAVGEHLMLGGDNMDLALAKSLEGNFSQPMDVGRFAQLMSEARAAKEKLLGKDAPERTTVTLLGAGSKLMGGTKSAEVSRKQVDELVLEGFFPAVAFDEAPLKRASAIIEFGLPYVADPAVTKHLAAFLMRHQAEAREAMGADGSALVLPDAVLFNGGVFHSKTIEKRIVDLLTDWRSKPALVLENSDPDLAVARGAVAYALARRGVGLKIGGGSARSYFLALPADESGPKGICLLPRGAEEGEELVLRARTFSLSLGRPVRFGIVASASEKQTLPGELVAIDGSSFTALPPLAAVLGAAATGKSETVTVQIAAALTEVGTLELSCIDAGDAARRWKLEFQTRGAARDSEAAAATVVTQLHPRFAQAKERIARVYGKSAEDVDKREIKTLRADLEKLLGERESWDSALSRELFGAVLAGAKRRRRSADHERVWFHLAGYTLRPGFGYPLDDWRVKELSALYDQGVQFVPEPQVWSEWWTLWRRIAGGLSTELQNRIVSDLEYYLEPPSRSQRVQSKPSGPKKLGVDDMMRLVAVLEGVDSARKAKIGDWLIWHLQNGGNAQIWWSVGRLGARASMRGNAHNVVDRNKVISWLTSLLETRWSLDDATSFAAVMLSRMTGDRQRDIPEDMRRTVLARLEAVRAPASWLAMVREVTVLAESDERRVFGESLPQGLKLLE